MTLDGLLTSLWLHRNDEPNGREAPSWQDEAAVLENNLAHVRKLKVENAQRHVQPEFILLSPPAFINAKADERFRVVD